VSTDNIFLSAEIVSKIASQLQYNGETNQHHRYSRSDNKSANRKKRKLNLKHNENERKAGATRTTAPATHMFRDLHWQQVQY
jgi:hypothetical protein